MAKRKKQSDVKRARQEARPVELPRADEQLSVAIVGGGASGIAAACAVAACARAVQVGVRVVLLEKGRRMGSSILRSGNGRCNFSHEDMRPVLFNQPAFVEQVFDALEAAFANSPLKTSGAPVRSAYENAVLQWFTSLGLVWREAPLSGGALYPFSNKAASVLEVLEAELDRCNVERYCGVTVAQIARQQNRFALEVQRTEEGSQGKGASLLRMQAVLLPRMQKAQLWAIEKPSLLMLLSMLRAEALLPFTNRAFSQHRAYFHAACLDRLLPRQSYFLVLMVFVRVFV